MIRDAVSDDAARVAGIYNYYLIETVVTFEASTGTEAE